MKIALVFHCLANAITSFGLFHFTNDELDRPFFSCVSILSICFVCLDWCGLYCISLFALPNERITRFFMFLFASCRFRGIRAFMCVCGVFALCVRGIFIRFYVNCV